MLSSAQNRVYQAFQQSLIELQTNLSQADRSHSHLKQQVQTLQECFQQEILPLTEAIADPAQQGRLQAIQIEIDKQLRLLAMDMLFLQAARQSKTADQRCRQIGDRLTHLLNYCNSLLGNSDP